MCARIFIAAAVYGDDLLMADYNGGEVHSAMVRRFNAGELEPRDEEVDDQTLGAKYGALRGRALAARTRIISMRRSGDAEDAGPSVISGWYLLLAGLAGCGRMDFDAIATTSDARAMSDAPAVADIGSGIDMAVGPPALVQTSVVAVASNGVTVTLPASSTAGTLLVATIASNGVNPIGLPPSWTLAVWIGTGGGCYATIAFELNNPGNETSFVFSQGAGIPTLGQITEWSGLATLDATGTATSASPTTSQLVQTGSVTTVPDELGIDVFCEDVNTPTYSPGTGWTSVGTYSNVPSAPSFSSDYRLGLAAGMISETQTSSGPGKYSAAIATFRPQ